MGRSAAPGKRDDPRNREAPGSGEPGAARRYTSTDLFGDGRRIIIEHNDQQYVLLITRRGKLLLNRSS